MSIDDYNFKLLNTLTRNNKLRYFKKWSKITPLLLPKKSKPQSGKYYKWWDS